MSTLKSSNDHLTLNADGTSKDIKFQANGVEKASISSAGAFTSTTIDATKLTGNLPAISGALLTNLPAGGVDGIVSSANATAITIDSGEHVFMGATSYSGGGDTPVLYVSNSTSTRQMKIHNPGGSTSSLQITNSVTGEGDDNGLQIATLGSGKCSFWNTEETGMGFGTSASERMLISSTGNCAHTYTGGGGGMTINRSDSSGAATLLQFFTGANLRGYISYNGSAVVYSTSSDYRLKENVVPLPDSIERVKQLKPSRFNFIENPTIEMDGFLAHEVAEIVPEAITGEKDAMKIEEYELTPATSDSDAVMGEREVIDPQGIDQSKLVPVMCSAIQQLITMNEDLTARVEALEAL